MDFYMKEDKEIIVDVNLNGGIAILTSIKHKSGSDRIFEFFEISKILNSASRLVFP